MVAAGEKDDGGGVPPIPDNKSWFFFVSFYEHSRWVARLSKYEITLCIGNTHVLKLRLL